MNFSNIYEQLRTVEYYLFVQIYHEIFEQAHLTGSDKFHVTLPKLSTILYCWTDQVHINLADRKWTRLGQFERRFVDLSFIQADHATVHWLLVGLQTYLGRSNSILNQINDYDVQMDVPHAQKMKQLQDLLFLTKLLREVRYSEKMPHKSNNAFFLHLLKLVLNADELNPASGVSEDDKPTAKQKAMASLSLKISLSALSYVCRGLTILDPLAPWLVQSETLLSKLVISSFKRNNLIKDKYPKMVVYMLQNINQLALDEFQSRKETLLPLGCCSKALKFVLESIAIYFDTNQIKVQINKNEIIQSPNIHQTILNSFRLPEFEEALFKKMQLNQIAHDTQLLIKDKLNNVKLHLWRFTLLMWLMQCSFKANNCDDADQQEWQIRHSAILQLFRLKNQEATSPKMADNHLHSLYFDTDQPNSLPRGNHMLLFISRALVDPQFHSFVDRLPKVMQFYAVSQKDEIYDK